MPQLLRGSFLRYVMQAKLVCSHLLRQHFHPTHCCLDPPSSFWRSTTAAKSTTSGSAPHRPSTIVVPVLKPNLWSADSSVSGHTRCAVGELWASQEG